MRRIFWAMLGLGMGAVAGAQAARWANRTTQRLAPENLARSAARSLGGVKERFREAVEAGLEEMSAREAEIREELRSRR